MEHFHHSYIFLLEAILSPTTHATWHSFALLASHQSISLHLHATACLKKPVSSKWRKVWFGVFFPLIFISSQSRSKSFTMHFVPAEPKDGKSCSNQHYHQKKYMPLIFSSKLGFFLWLWAQIYRRGKTALSSENEAKICTRWYSGITKNKTKCKVSQKLNKKHKWQTQLHFSVMF